MNDFSARELSVMFLMVVALVWLGVYPQHVLNITEPVLQALGIHS